MVLVVVNLAELDSWGCRVYKGNVVEIPLEIKISLRD